MKLTQQQELLGQVISKAWEDESFKKDLISNPVEAIEKLTGKKIELPEGKTVVVRDQTDESTFYINIPTKPDLNDIELTEEHLEQVAGGDFLLAAAVVGGAYGLYKLYEHMSD